MNSQKWRCRYLRRKITHLSAREIAKLTGNSVHHDYRDPLALPENNQRKCQSGLSDSSSDPVGVDAYRQDKRMLFNPNTERLIDKNASRLEDEGGGRSRSLDELKRSIT